MAPLQAFVSSEVLTAFCIAGILITICISLLRLYVRFSKQNRLLEDDFALFVAVLLYIGLASAYMADIPNMYPVMDWLANKTPVDESLLYNYAQMIRYNWAVQILYWAVLWMVKISLLLFFRRVIMRTQGVYMGIWWAISAFTIATFAGCIVTLFTACDSIEDNFILGHCISPRNTRHQIISLYYSFAADVLTDVLIMALPLRIVLNLNVARRKDKYKLAALFSVQSIAIIFSVLRVAFTWARTGFKTPSPPWLGLWALIEGMVAIIVGCIPAISQVFRSGGGPPAANLRAASPPNSDAMLLQDSSRFSAAAAFSTESYSLNRPNRTGRQRNWYDDDELDGEGRPLAPTASYLEARRKLGLVPLRPAYFEFARKDILLTMETPMTEQKHRDGTLATMNIIVV